MEAQPSPEVSATVSNARRFHVVLNPKSGTALALGLNGHTLKDRLEALGHNATVDADDSVDFQERISRAARSDADVVVAAGGDGTATALAAALADSDKCLAVLPLGSANLLARDLKVPIDLDRALEALGTMVSTQIDVGEVNGRIFLHSVVVGVIPSIAVAREKVRGQRNVGAIFRFAQYLVRRLGNARRVAVSITSRDAQDRVERIHAVAVVNNAYDEGFGKVFTRQRLNEGVLTLYVLRHLSIRDMLRLGVEMVAGRWQDDHALNIETVGSVTIGAREPSIASMIDGEVTRLQTPLRFRVRPSALSILAVPSEPDSSHPAN